jgi:hypothetical protein
MLRLHRKSEQVCVIWNYHHRRIGEVHHESRSSSGSPSIIERMKALTYPHAIVTNPLVGAGEDGWFELERGGACRCQAAKMLLSQVHQLGMVHCACCRDNESVRCVMGLNVRLQVIAGEILDIFVGPEDRATEAGAHKGSAVQFVEDYLFVLLAYFQTL